MPELQRQRSRTARYLHYCRLIATFLFSHIGLGALVIAYSSVGAAIFQALEEQHELQTRSEVENERAKYADKLWDLSIGEIVFKKENWSEKAISVLHDYEAYLLKMTKKQGFDGKEVTAATRWGFMGSLLYSITMITTIGYGDRVPRTYPGKVGTIIYAVAGIPLMSIFLMNIGNLLARSTKYLYWRFCKTKERNESKRRRERRRRTRSRRESVEEIPMRPIPASQFTDHSDAIRTPIISNKYALQSNALQSNGDRGFSSIPGYSRPDSEQISGDSYSSEDSEDQCSDTEDYKRTKVPIRMCVGLLLGYSLIGAKLFGVVEGWDFFISIYFCFQTLTTIGFGDYVPGDTFTSETDTSLILVACALYLVFGLGLVAMTLTLVRDTVSDSVRRVGKKIGIIKDDSDSE